MIKRRQGNAFHITSLLRAALVATCTEVSLHNNVSQKLSSDPVYAGVGCGLHVGAPEVQVRTSPARREHEKALSVI